QAALVDHPDELLEHLLGDREVGDDAVLHGADGLDVARHLAEHLLGLGADRGDGLLGVRTAFLADGDHRRLVENDALAAYIDQRVRGAEVYGEVVRKVLAQKPEHAGPVCGEAGCAAAGWPSWIRQAIRSTGIDSVRKINGR